MRCRSGAYPRGRGGIGRSRGRVHQEGGLSPRTRGNHDRSFKYCVAAGPIPADAGESPASASSKMAWRAYPRGRGGAPSVIRAPVCVMGLSPRTRGSHHQLTITTHEQGPIPADAGEPTGRVPRNLVTRAYPRGRGGAVTRRSSTVERQGLSPRTRGSPQAQRDAPAGYGPIPADAGEPHRSARRARGGRAYPRGRGGAEPHGIAERAVVGLSPRTRGSPFEVMHIGAAPGPIPADAGEPMRPPVPAARRRAYPRGRGGAIRYATLDLWAKGLSPRTRGSHAAEGLHHAGDGPIPADAGEPWAWACSSSSSRAYPRGRGGAARQDGGAVFCWGLSPRTRGSPCPARRAWRGRGPIPADAGEPSAAMRGSSSRRAYPRGRGGALWPNTIHQRLEGLSPRTRGSRPWLAARRG